MAIVLVETITEIKILVTEQQSKRQKYTRALHRASDISTVQYSVVQCSTVQHIAV